MSKATNRPLHQRPEDAKSQQLADRAAQFTQTAHATTKAERAAVKAFTQSSKQVLANVPASPTRNLGTFGGRKPSLITETTAANKPGRPR